mgnify:CR=1 FL=1
MHGDVKVVGYQDFAWKVPVPAHRRTHGGIILVRDGSGTLGVGRADDAEGAGEAAPASRGISNFTVHKGDMVIYLPYEDHSYLPDKGSVLAVSMIRFELPTESAVGEHVDLLGADRKFSALPEIEELFAYVRNRLSEGREFATRAAESATAAMLNQALAERTVRPPAVRETPIDQAMEALYGDFSARLSNVAEDLGLSVETIRREFRRHFGNSPMHYFTAYRISAIAYRLETEDVPLHELAEDYGFYDEFHLSRVFKRYIGVPPSEYRKTRTNEH